MDTEILLNRVTPLFADGGRFAGRYTPDGAPPLEVLPGSMWELGVFPAGSRDCAIMRVYAFDSTLGPALQAHWRNEARALLRLSTRAHGALPKLREADVLPKLELGYVIVSDSGSRFADDVDAQEALFAERLRAFRAFFGLVEAIGAMHEEGLLHRSLTAEALRVVNERFDLAVDGFQMSSFVATWFQASAVNEKSISGPTSAVARWMLAPERLRVLERRTAREVESYAMDVFGLGMIGIHLFTGGLEAPPKAYSENDHRLWSERQQQRLRAQRVPRALERLLLAMTAVERRNRVPSAVAAHESLCKAYGAILSELEWRGADPPVYEVLYLRESIQRLYDDGRGQSHPTEPDYLEYNRLIEEDLVAGVLLWSERGFEPWERFGDRSVAQQAKVVLLGREYAYFCAYLDSTRRDEDRTRIVVKHILPIHKASRLRHVPKQRSVPRVRCAHIERNRRGLAPNPHSWADLVATIEDRRPAAFQDPVIAASSWLLEAQAADLRSSWYQVDRIDLQGDRVVYRATNEQPETSLGDREASFDRLWASVVDPQPMARAFEEIARRQSERGEPAVFSAKRSREDGEGVAELRFESMQDPATCVFRISSSAGEPPERGWLVPDDRGARNNLRNQRDALAELEHRYIHLAAQLRNPRAVRIPLQVSPPSAGVDDETAQLLRQIHETWPIFVLQGPPGTGKTFVASRLVKRILAEDRFARILISAQSHHALDNLLEDVVKGTDGTSTLRVASERTQSKLTPVALEHLLQSRVEQLLKGIADSQAAPLPQMRLLTKEWKKRAKAGDLELRADLLRRLPRASTVVYATAGQATHESIGSSRGAGSFDWVLVEEAARGWLTEFLVPMVHGAPSVIG